MPDIALFNWLTLTASVPWTPGATFEIVRSAPGEPTDTVFGSLATEPAPRATELFAGAFAPCPIATLPAPVALAPEP
ncbi:hypothetical protein WS58_32190 [Burkholderia pseudomultivorans]|nr:hypothetical protein WS58_32190 [Burkholderia pseudomultivorans]KWF06942.1 hypothetical protein WT55_19680 [Burkholderia pseudomultivorans]